MEPSSCQEVGVENLSAYLGEEEAAALLEESPTRSAPPPPSPSGQIHFIKKDMKKKKKPPKVFQRKSTLGGLFRYASNGDRAILGIGLIFSVLHGSSFPVLALVFGEMTNTFMRVSKFGFLDSENGYNMSTTSSSMNTSKSNITEGITKDKFLVYMAQYSVYYVYISIGVLITSFIQTYCWELVSERQVYKLRQIFFSQLLRQDASWYDKNNQGDFNVKLTDDMERIREGIGSKFSMVTQHLATFVTGLAVGFYVNPKLTAVIVGLGPILIITSAYWAKAASSSAAREQLKYSKAGGVAEEVLTCIKTVIAFGGIEKECSRYKKELEEGRLLAMKKYYMISAGVFFVYFVMYSSYGLAFWYGSVLIGSGISTPGSVFTVFFSVLIGAFSIGNSLPYLNSISTAVGAASTLSEIIDRVPSIDSYSDDGHIPQELNGYIEFKNVAFNYPTRPDVMVLNSLNFKISPGQVISVVGPSGAGKSTIVSLLMRLYDPSEGQVMVDGFDIRNLNLKWLRQQIGIVTQEPVLFGVSILDNISYGRENISEQDIIAAAKLANAHLFIQDLPEGYNTLVGIRGAQLSGGQKQRIALARALVRDPKILLLDEATSALDTESEAIVQAALEDAMKGRTTIVIAHRLSTIRNADTIYVMKDGCICEQGTHTKLMENTNLYYNLVMAQANELEKNENQSFQGIQDNNLEGSKPPEYLNLTAPDIMAKKPGNEQVSFFKLLRMNAPEWYWLTVGLLSCSLSGLVTPTYAFFYGEIFSTFTLFGDELNSTAIFWSFMFVTLGVVSGLSCWIQIICMTTAAEKLISRLRFLALKNILCQPVSWFDLPKCSTGHLITRLARDAPLIKSVTGLRIGQVVTSFMTLAAALSIAFIYGWKLAIILLFAAPLLFASASHQASLIRKNQTRDSALMDEAGKLASECIQNIKTVQALGKEHSFLKLYCNYLLVPFEENMKQALVYGITFAFSQMVVYIMYAAAFRFGGYLIGIEEMVPSEVFRVFFALSFCATALGNNSAYYQDFTKAKVAARNIFELITVKSDVDPMSDYGVKPDIKGKITFRNVKFCYPNRESISVLDNLNLTISPGETIAIVGGSGCGKSTIVSLIERFYTPNSGEILIDDADIRVMNLAYLRSVIGLVGQEPVLFDCSLKENILYGAIALRKPIMDHEIIKAAKMANIHDFIASLPQGYETYCGENGTQLSGGQKQRIAIARALVRDPKILILDEATSALDNENEKIVQASLNKARIGRTTIVIAHRLSTIKAADKIAVLDQGKIIEIGTPEELEQSDGFYYKLIKGQQI